MLNLFSIFILLSVSFWGNSRVFHRIVSSLFSPGLLVLLHDRLNLSLDHVDVAFIVEALRFLHERVQHTFKVVHIRKLVMHDTAGQEFISDLRSALSNLLVKLILFVNLLLLANELLLHNRKHSVVEILLDVLRLRVGLSMNGNGLDLCFYLVCQIYKTSLDICME